MKQLIKQYCLSLGLDCVGIAPPGPYPELADRLQKRIDQGHSIEFDETDILKRTTPQLIMADVQSIIVCLFPYYIGQQKAANVSKYTYSRDYHLIIKEKLAQIQTYLQSLLPDFQSQAFADTGPLADRYLAYLAGLGFYGINSCLITDKYGSYFFIGYLLTNVPFTPDMPLNRVCLQCGRCQAACPGQIILGDFTIDPRGCKSYLTQKKAALSPAEVAIIGKTPLVFGCDICQDVCPHNRNIAVTPLIEFQNDLLPAVRDDELIPLSNKEFRRLFGDRAFSWRGKQILLRNLNITAGQRSLLLSSKQK
ncbi:tRNA epoxyqueuosine(34) reductase QueG [Anaerospora sp.]|uniref:tRNA epoxyqueuosine(34) reductase QueG n=1 Tax=Anaerospora sp. TaxID=1960278 RepID=UPI00289CE955|nr:tRNA epoxyqueuosine(34) reductase QueG [Anaerospora sp.]